MTQTRVAALYDIHGNLPALEAVLGELHEARVDLIVVGGDVLPGPMPREALALVRGLGVPMLYVRGNGEREVLGIKHGRDTLVPAQFHPMMRWVGEQLTPHDEDFIDGSPASVTVDVEGLGSVLFCHATARNDSEIFTADTPDTVVAPMFAGVSSPLIVCGHTHVQFDRQVGPLRIVNAGSVGMPFGERGAHWLLLGPAVELRRTTYDADSAAVRIRATDYPGAAEFAAAPWSAPLKKH